MAMDPFWAWIFVEPENGLENNITKVKHMYDTSYFLPACLNNCKLSSQEQSLSCFLPAPCLNIFAGSP
jgi:hypothetical protein